MLLVRRMGFARLVPTPIDQQARHAGPAPVCCDLPVGERVANRFCGAYPVCSPEGMFERARATDQPPSVMNAMLFASVSLPWIGTLVALSATSRNQPQSGCHLGAPRARVKTSPVPMDPPAAEAAHAAVQPRSARETTELSGMVRKQTNTSRPPAFMPLRILVKALIGSSKNITPNCE